MESNNSYVYQHYYDDINKPFYIGIAIHNTYYKLTMLKNYNTSPRYKYSRAYDKHLNGNWKSFVEEKGTKWNVQILLDNLTHTEANNNEKLLISKYGRLDNGTGILVNRTDGGSGSRGCICLEDTKRKISNSLKKYDDDKLRIKLKYLRKKERLKNDLEYAKKDKDRINLFRSTEQYKQKRKEWEKNNREKLLSYRRKKVSSYND